MYIEKRNQIILFIIIIALFIFAYVMVVLIQENQKCLSNPFLSGARQLQKQGMNVICSCQSYGGSGFFFDNNSIYYENP